MDSTNRSDETARFERYATREADDGSLVVYDEQNDEAWLRSDVTVESLR